MLSGKGKLYLPFDAVLSFVGALIDFRVDLEQILVMISVYMSYSEIVADFTEKTKSVYHGKKR